MVRPQITEELERLAKLDAERLKPAVLILEIVRQMVLAEAARIRKEREPHG